MEKITMTAEGVLLSRRPWYTFARLFLYAMGVLTLVLIMCGNQGCGAEDETAPPVVVAAGGDAGGQNNGNSGGYGQNGSNNGACTDEVEATLWVDSLYGGQVVCGGTETPFDEGVEVSGICMANSGFSFVIYTEGNSTFTASYEDGRPATLEFRVGTAPPELQSELVLDWGAVTVVTVP